MATTYIGHLPDAELVRRAQLGDEAATTALIERYRRFARAKCRGYFIVGGDAQDLEQEALIGLLQAVHEYRAERGGALRSFIELCVTRQIITAVRAASRRKHQPLNRSVSMAAGPSERSSPGVPLEEMLVDEATPEPADVVVSAETVLEMEGTLSDTLSALELQVLRLHRSGRSYAEIARALNRNTKAVDNTLQRIKRKLERRLQAPSSEGAP